MAGSHMVDDVEGVHRAVFIVRVNQDLRGRVTAVVERVRTGEKAAVDALADVGSVLAAMLTCDEPKPTPPS